jgi:MFS superfamily sulfate permease-like transporter
VDAISLLQEGIAVGRTFASLRGYQVDGNKEMMAIGLMNVVGSCTSCYVTTGTVFFSPNHVQSLLRFLVNFWDQYQDRRE